MIGIIVCNSRMISNTHTQVFQCTRHATSCNNIDMGKGLIKKDSEPALSVYGITEAIKLAKREKEKGSTRFIAPPGIPIAVSGLIRTWETAVLLYGYQIHSQQSNQGYTQLEIRVCPWLRETSGWGSAFDVGNMPKEIKHSIPKFIKFLNTLINVYDFADKNYRINTINIYIPSTNSKNNASLNSIGDWQIIQIHLNESKNEYMLHNNILCNIRDTIYNKYGYQNEVGDIMKFMQWYTRLFPYSKEMVHIVAHSQIMQQFVKKNLGTSLDEDITQQNCWSLTMEFHTKYDKSDSIDIIDSIQNGFNKPKGDKLTSAKELEKSKQAGSDPTSLCGTCGSVEDIKCTMNGGRKTRRRRHHKKKTRRYRR